MNEFFEICPENGSIGIGTCHQAQLPQFKILSPYGIGTEAILKCFALSTTSAPRHTGSPTSPTRTHPNICISLIKLQKIVLIYWIVDPHIRSLCTHGDGINKILN